MRTLMRFLGLAVAVAVLPACGGQATELNASTCILKESYVADWQSRGETTIEQSVRRACHRHPVGLPVLIDSATLRRAAPYAELARIHPSTVRLVIVQNTVFVELLGR